MNLGPNLIECFSRELSDNAALHVFDCAKKNAGRGNDSADSEAPAGVPTDEVERSRAESP